MTDAAPQTITKAGWKKLRDHTVTLPSGSVVKIRIPDLPALIETGQIPQSLIEVAVDVATGRRNERPGADVLKQQREFTDLVVLKTVVEPAITEDDLADIPYEDKEMLVEFATRQIDFDAEGNHLSGLDKSEKFRRFRRIREFDPAMAGL